MITLKSKTKHAVQHNRQIIQKDIYLTITRIEVTGSGIVTHGYYYFVQDGNQILLDGIVPVLLDWESIAQAETALGQVTCNNFKTVVYKRVEEFALIKLKAEGTSNYGVKPEDWEILNATEDEELAN